MLLTALVVPCYNEAERFPLAVFEAFLQRHDNVVVILVNDGSRDKTAAILERLRIQFPQRVFIIDREINKGKAETVREGMLYAFQLSPAPGIVGFWDADLATPLDALFDLAPILETQPEIQMVFGARVNLLGRRIQRKPVRHYLGRIFATTVSAMLGLPIYDTQCGTKLFRATPQVEAICREPFITRWVFDVEMISRWIQLYRFDRERVKHTVYEFPLYAWEDVGGSKVRPYDFILSFLDILRIYLRYFLGKPPASGTNH
jgi:glycosyltransferase involved in cell wall biosynthesis